MNAAQREALQQFVRHLAAAISTATLYPITHKQVKHLCAEALASLSEGIGSDTEVTLIRVEDELIAGGIPLESSMYVSRLSRVLKEKEISHIRIRRQVVDHEILTLISDLGKKGKATQDLLSTENIRLGQVEVRVADRYSRGRHLARRNDPLSGNVRGGAKAQAA